MMHSSSHLKINKIKSWGLALRPKTLVAGIIPVLVGSFSTPIPFDLLDWVLIVSALLVSMAMTIAVNLINDALDFKRGADTKERIGPQRVTQSGLLSQKQVLSAGVFVLFLAFILALPLILKGGTPILVLVLASIICAYLYTGGPYPLSYNGLGELFVILFYGFGAVLATYYLQMGYITLDAVIASLQIGLLATVLIAVNNLRDIQEDKKTGKRTLAARFGVFFGKCELTALIGAPFLINIYWYATDRFLAFVLPSIALLIGINLMRGIWRHAPSRLYNRYLAEASLLLAVFGLLLIMGLRAAN